MTTENSCSFCGKAAAPTASEIVHQAISTIAALASILADMERAASKPIADCPHCHLPLRPLTPEEERSRVASS